MERLKLGRQIFTILGLRRRSVVHGECEGIAIPLVYAHLTHKTTKQYAAVPHAVQEAVDVQPRTIHIRFWKSDTECVRRCVSESEHKLLFFHLGQSLYRRIQEVGLQVQYNNPDDRTIKTRTHMLLALAFVPISDVRATFQLLTRNRNDAVFKPMLDYFDKTYVNETPCTGPRLAVAPHYPPALWITMRQQSTKTIAQITYRRNVTIDFKSRPPRPVQRIARTSARTSRNGNLCRVVELGKKSESFSSKHKWVLVQERI